MTQRPSLTLDNAKHGEAGSGDPREAQNMTAPDLNALVGCTYAFLPLPFLLGTANICCSPGKGFTLKSSQKEPRELRRSLPV